MRAKKICFMIFIGIISFGGLSLLLYLSSIAYWYWYLLPREVEKFRIQTKQILYETDHEMLLTDCREIMRKAAAGTFPVGEYLFADHPVSEIQTLKIPESIMRLNPMKIIVDEKYLEISMHGGWYHFGVVAYKKNKYVDTALGNMELIDGLWYFDDEFYENDNYEAYLKSLDPKK